MAGWLMAVADSSSNHQPSTSAISHQPSAITLSYDTSGNPDHDSAGADDGVLADRDAVEDFRARAEPRAVADRDAGRPPRLIEHGARRIGEVVIAADHVAVGGHQHPPADRDAARREHFAVEAEVRAVAQLDVAVLAR